MNAECSLSSHFPSLLCWLFVVGGGEEVKLFEERSATSTPTAAAADDDDDDGEGVRRVGEWFVVGCCFVFAAVRGLKTGTPSPIGVVLVIVVVDDDDGVSGEVRSSSAEVGLWCCFVFGVLREFAFCSMK